LNGVFGVGAVPEHPERDRVQARAVALEQDPQADRVAGLRAAREHRVAGTGHDAILARRRAAVTVLDAA